jgi:hypothetical protein
MFRGKHGQVALDDFCNICTQQILPPCPHGLDESPYQAKIAATVMATFPIWLMYFRLTRAEICHGKLVHIADDLPESKVPAGLSLADQ